MTELQSVEIPIKGMDCAECTQHVQHAIGNIQGVESVTVLLASEKAIVRLDPTRVKMPMIQQAVADAGYAAGESIGDDAARQGMGDFSNRVLSLFAIVFGLVLFVVVVGEWLGLFEALTASIPFWAGALVVFIAGAPVFWKVTQSAFHRQITSHTLMSIGVLASLAVGQWATAMVVLCFIYVGDYVERFTTERARRAVKNLTMLAPQSARVQRESTEIELPIAEVKVGDVVIVRPGEKIPVDGQVVEGHAAVNQAAITGESMPKEVSIGSEVYAATIAQAGSLRVRTTRIGADTTFGLIIRLVEESEANRAEVQRFADRFTVYFLPIVAGVAALTFLIRRDPLATAAVLVVACSCSIALATPIAMLASVGAAAQRGLLIKGGKYLEALARADVVLIDKTGTLTYGKPQITEIVALSGMPKEGLLALAASAGQDSEHPLGRAVREEAHARNLPLTKPSHFRAVAGMGVSADVNNQHVVIGNRRMFAEPLEHAETRCLEAQGMTCLYVMVDEKLEGILAASDTMRREVPEALDGLRSLGIKKIELLTGDNEQTALALAKPLNIDFRANLLPEDKIAIVKEYQRSNHIVVMIGDGVNDAPALAQANVGIAMGAAGTDVALEAAHIALMRDDWRLVPEVFRIARRTMTVVKTNLVFTGVYNSIGIALAAFGFLPPILAAAAQSLPDLGILANSARLLRQK